MTGKHNALFFSLTLQKLQQYPILGTIFFMHSTHCLNCENPVTEQDKFCPHCGQKIHLHPITLGHIAHDGMHFFLHADKSIFTLVKKLAATTGVVAKEFIEGKRKKYFSPFNFFMIVAGLVVLSMSLFQTFEKENANTQLQLQAMAAQIADPVKKAKFLSVVKRQARTMLIVKKYSNIISMITVPLLAAIFSLFYVKRKYNYAEHVVANMYSTGFTSLVMAFIIIPLLASGNQYIFIAVMIANILFDIIYRGIFYYKFMNRQGTVALLKAIGISLFAQVFIMTLTLALLFWYMVSGMNGLFS
jgi:Protein of unknown function (DUF3667)